MRCFIAIPIPADVKKHLSELEKIIDNIKGDSKLVFVKDFHLTLKFLGDIEENKIDSLKHELGKIRPDKFSVEISELGVFPSEDQIRVVWVGIKPEDKIAELQKKIEKSINFLNIAQKNIRQKKDVKQEKKFKQEKDFKAHLTLARVKFIKHKKEFIENLKTVMPKKLTFDISCFKLIKSTLTPEGPKYEDLAVFESS